MVGRCGYCDAVVVCSERWRVYATWPYVVSPYILGVALHERSVHAALCGVILALPSTADTRSLAVGARARISGDRVGARSMHAENEAATAGANSAESIRRIRISGIGRAAISSRRHQSGFCPPADRIERAVAVPWIAYEILRSVLRFPATGVESQLRFFPRQCGRFSSASFWIGPSANRSASRLRSFRRDQGAHCSRARRATTVQNFLGHFMPVRRWATNVSLQHGPTRRFPEVPGRAWQDRVLISLAAAQHWGRRS
jgi:hypothetical protein